MATKSLWLALASRSLGCFGGRLMRGGRKLGTEQKNPLPQKKDGEKRGDATKGNLALDLTLNGGGLEILLVRVHGVLSA